VIGVTREKGGAAANLDSSIFISPSLAVKVTGASSDRIMVLLRDDNQSIGVKNQITALLGPKFGAAMRVADAREAIERTKAIWGKQNLVGICLAAISLLTGGVGIMNIMLLSIHQRQKEIGLRKAVGARNSEIATQFLLETVIICVLGGMVGILVGWGFGQQVAKMLGDWEASMSLVSVLVALSFSVMTGVLFGATPAMRAARIDPYDALRTG
jgi:ABC-type antimicrobial peptide transport system permease subunit